VGKRQKLIVLAVFLIAFTGVLYFLFFTRPASPAHQVRIVKGLIKADIVPAKNANGIWGCTLAKKGCEDYVNIVPGRTIPTEKEYCLREGCLIWGRPATIAATVEFSDEEATSLLNDYKPVFIALNDVKIKFTAGRAYIEGTNLASAVPGYITLEAEQTGPKQIRLVKAYVGRVSLPGKVKDSLEKMINSWLGYEWFLSTLESFQFTEGKVVLNVQTPPEVLKAIGKEPIVSPEPVLEKETCQENSDCLLINQDRGFDCCWVSACDSIDYSLDNWIAVNKDWFIQGKNKNCPEIEECGPVPMCVGKVINDRFKPQCINNKCQKVPKTEACGIENCHGLNVVCGPNVAEFCTMQYELGDGCRKYATCMTIADRCQLVTTYKFDECKACVEKCIQDLGTDPVKTTDCETKCQE